MNIKIVFASGKEIELTEEEYAELKNAKRVIYVPIQTWEGPWTYPQVTYWGGQKTAINTGTGV